MYGGQLKYEQDSSGYWREYMYVGLQDRTRGWALRKVIGPSRYEHYKDQIIMSVVLMYMQRFYALIAPIIKKQEKVQKSRSMSYKLYTARELELIRECAEGDMSYKALRAILHDRSKSSLYNKINQAKRSMGIEVEEREVTKWTHRDHIDLRAYYLEQGMSIIECADAMCRTYGSVSSKVTSMGLAEERQKLQTV